MFQKLTFLHFKHDNSCNSSLAFRTSGRANLSTRPDSAFMSRIIENAAMAMFPSAAVLPSLCQHESKVDVSLTYERTLEIFK